MNSINDTEITMTQVKKTCCNNSNLLGIPDILDRAFWDKLPEDYKSQRITLAQEALTMPWPEILMSDYLRFSDDGNRVLYESKYFTRRRMLTQLVMGECIEHKGRFLSKIVDGLYLISGETTWCLPAHNSYIRDTKQYTIPDTSRPVVDLFAAETASVLAVAELMLRPVLKDISPYISDTLDDILYERVLSPYLNFHFWWMGNGLEPMCNWTPWITQNILLTAFSRPRDFDKNINAENSFSASTKSSQRSPAVLSQETHSAFSNSTVSSPELAKKLCDKKGIADPPDWCHKHSQPDEVELAKIYESAVKSIHHFLSEYSQDGCCDEGAQYYSHAGLCLYGCLSILWDIAPDVADRTATPCKNSSYNPSDVTRKSHTSIIPEFSEDIEKIKNIASYIMSVYVGDNYYINFADCSPHAGRRGAREYLFGALTDNPFMMSFAARDYYESSWAERLTLKEENLWYHVLNARCHKEMLELAERDLKTNLPVPDAWFPSTGLMVARSGDYVLAAKAGDNADSHNHNDVGSFILYKKNKPFIIDLGVGSYTKQTFSKDRYSIWTMQSQYHNIPVFYDENGKILMEHDGAEYRAEDTSCILNKTISLLSMDLSKAYPGLDGQLSRTIKLDKLNPDDNTIKAQDCGLSINGCSLSSQNNKNNITITDHYDGSMSFTEVLMLYEKPEIKESETDRSLYTISVGYLGEIDVKGITDVKIEEIKITDERLSETWHHSCYRLLLKAADKNVVITIR